MYKGFLMNKFSIHSKKKEAVYGAPSSSLEVSSVGSTKSLMAFSKL